MKDYKKITSIGMLCAFSYITVLLFRIPMMLFLSYEPKDIIIVISGFIFGPLSAFLISLIVSFVEMRTISQTGPIGFIMNVLSSSAFAVTASFIYKKKRTIKGAVWGLISGTAVMTVIMILWNYLITPLYMNLPRSEVVKLLIPAFLPFNLIKGSLNTSLTLILYKPLVKALRSARLVPVSQAQENSKNKISIWIFSLLIIVTSILIILALNGKI